MIGYKLYNELKSQAEIKKREKYKANEDFILGTMGQEEYQIKTFMLNEQINLLNNLARQELDRLGHLLGKDIKKDSRRYYRWAIVTPGKEGPDEIGDLGWFTGDCDEKYILKYCKEKGIKIIKNEVYEEKVQIMESK